MASFYLHEQKEEVPIPVTDKTESVSWDILLVSLFLSCSFKFLKAITQCLFPKQNCLTRKPRVWKDKRFQHETVTTPLQTVISEALLVKT